MISRLRRLGYKIIYEPRALVRRGREAGVLGLVFRTFRLSAERGRGVSQPGLSRLYLIALTALLVLLGASTIPRPNSHPALWASAAYGIVLACTGIHAAIRTKNPLVAIIVPPLMVMHHAAHLAGYAFGLATRLIRFTRIGHGAAKRGRIITAKEKVHGHAPLN